MLIVEREKNVSSYSINGKDSFRPVKPNLKFLPNLVLSIVILGLSMGVGGLLIIDKNLEGSFGRAAQAYQWLVLVEGQPLQVDEVGRYLNQIPGVTEVKYIKPDEMLVNLRKNSIFRDGIGDVDTSLLPVSWQIRWDSKVLTSTNFEEVYTDILILPGVLDIAYDNKLYEQALHSWKTGGQIKVLSSLLLLMATVGLVLFLGRALFFLTWDPFQIKKLIALLVQSSLVWGVGYVLLGKTLGWASPVFLGGGFFMGIIHYVYESTHEKK